MNTEKLFTTLKTFFTQVTLPIRKNTLIHQLFENQTNLFTQHNGNSQTFDFTKEDISSFLFFLNSIGTITMNPINGLILHQQIHRTEWSPTLHAKFQTFRINPPLLKELKQKRNELARQHHLKPYHICHNSFLEWLSIVQPTTLDQLYQKLPMSNGLIVESFLLHLIDVIRQYKGMGSLSTLIYRMNHLHTYITTQRTHPKSPFTAITPPFNTPTEPNKLAETLSPSSDNFTINKSENILN